MAGDGWVMDIIFHALILVANALVNLWSNWSIEILLVGSFGMQFVLTIIAGFRWRGASSALRNVIWLYYIGGDYVATTALGNLSVSKASGERQLVAFWAPFFLLHLGGPDNITAYELEDNELSARYVLELIPRIFGATYVVYKSISGSRTLVLAARLMLLVGVAKYVEKILALHRANLGSIRSSVKNQRRRARGGRRYTNPMLPGDRGNDNSAMLMVAHSLFHICKRAMVDSSKEMESGDVADSIRILFKLPWRNMYRVMEIELSLMYDLLYTKAAVIHTWHGYCIRVLSPLATAAALLLVEFSDQDGHRQADVVITHILLVATFLLETASLLRALGSSWTAFLLYDTQRWGWFHHQVFCTSRWHRFRRVVASFGRLAKVKGHRRWSGHIGQLNLLQFSTREQPSRAAKENAGQELGENEERSSETIVIPQDVKEDVFRQTFEELVQLRNTIREGNEKAADMQRESRTKRGQRTLLKWKLYNDFRWSLGAELQEGILTWHIATDIYLFKSDIANKAGDASVAQRNVEAIRTLSNYMMFLLVERPYMLPGLVLRRLYELTCEDLVGIWSRYGTQDDLKSSSSFWSTLPWKLFQPHDDPGSSRLRQRKEKLARILCDEEHKFEPDDVKGYLSSGIELAKKLLSLDESRKSDVPQVILEVWVEMLFYASYRCNKESHARQLSSGGELTTIVWLMAEHIGLFTISRKGKAAEEASWKRRKDTKHAR